MSSLRSEPFLWIHLAGIALFPLFLEIVWLGLAVGTPSPWFILEFLLVAIVGIVPVLWMQLARPFDIFSVLLFSLKPECLTIEQRQILTLFKKTQQKWLSAIAAGLMLAILWSLYRLSPLAIEFVSFLPQWRSLGLMIAIIAFWGGNLFLQVPLSVLGVLFHSKLDSTTIAAYPVEKIAQDFTIPGLKVNQILSVLPFFN